MPSDAALFRKRMVDLRNGRTVLLPGEVAGSMLKGSTLLRALRKWRGVTLADLSKMAGVGLDDLSDLEAQPRRKAAPEAWIRIAQALDVPVEWVER